MADVEDLTGSGEFSYSFSGLIYDWYAEINDSLVIRKNDRENEKLTVSNMYEYLPP